MLLAQRYSDKERCMAAMNGAEGDPLQVVKVESELFPPMTERTFEMWKSIA
jgi:hypothetical protein